MTEIPLLLCRSKTWKDHNSAHIFHSIIFFILNWDFLLVQQNFILKVPKLNQCKIITETYNKKNKTSKTEQMIMTTRSPIFSKKV